MGIVYRPYQVDAIRSGIGFFRESSPEPSLSVLPTAAGKSIIIAGIVKSTPGKMLVIQPSKELLGQNYEKYLLSGGIASIYSASFPAQRFVSRVH